MTLPGSCSAQRSGCVTCGIDAAGRSIAWHASGATTQTLGSREQAGQSGADRPDTCVWRTRRNAARDAQFREGGLRVCAVAQARRGSCTSIARSNDNGRPATIEGARPPSSGAPAEPCWVQDEQSSECAEVSFGLPIPVVASPASSDVAATSCTFPPVQTSIQPVEDSPVAARAGISTGMSECSSIANTATSDTLQRIKRRAFMGASIVQAIAPSEVGSPPQTAEGKYYRATRSTMV